MAPHLLPSRLARPSECRLSRSRRARATSVSPSRRSGAQALVEFALLVPGLLATFGMCVDVARIFGSAMELQSVTRDAAEAAATDARVTTLAEAGASVTGQVCAALSGTATCPAGVRVLAPASAGDFVAGPAIRPIYRVTVTAERDVQSLFLWPLIKSVTGSDQWTLRSSVTYEVWRGRL